MSNNEQFERDIQDELEVNENPSKATEETKKKGKGGLIAGLILIGIGLLSLLERYVPNLNWLTSWPIALIVVGVILIVPFKNKKS